MPTEYEQIAARRELLRIQATRERERAQALIDTPAEAFIPPPACAECGKPMQGKTTPAPNQVLHCGACSPRRKRASGGES